MSYIGPNEGWIPYYPEELSTYVHTIPPENKKTIYVEQTWALILKLWEEWVTNGLTDQEFWTLDKKTWHLHEIIEEELHIQQDDENPIQIEEYILHSMDWKLDWMIQMLMNYKLKGSIY